MGRGVAELTCCVVERPLSGSGGDVSALGAPKREPRSPMIDWTAVFATLTGEFILDSISSRETASGKPPAYLSRVVVHWSKEGRIKPTARGVYRKTQFQGRRKQARAD